MNEWKKPSKLKGQATGLQRQSQGIAEESNMLSRETGLTARSVSHFLSGVGLSVRFIVGRAEDDRVVLPRNSLAHCQRRKDAFRRHPSCLNQESVLVVFFCFVSPLSILPFRPWNKEQFFAHILETKRSLFAFKEQNFVKAVIRFALNRDLLFSHHP